MKGIMRYLLLLVSATAAFDSDPPNCAKCLYLPWFIAVTGEPESRGCEELSVTAISNCLLTCVSAPVDKPKSFRIRQLTQIADILRSLQKRRCLSDGGQCMDMAECFLSTANFVNRFNNNATDYAAYATVFDYKCGPEVRAAASYCLNQTTCFDPEITEKIITLMLDGIAEACDDPRRCVTYANIFEVKPGSGCTEFYQEAAAYGPSIDQTIKTTPGLGFDPSICRTEYLSELECPADPEVPPIFSEFPPPAETTTQRQPVYGDISVDIESTCETCLAPIWQRAVTTSGDHLCKQGFVECSSLWSKLSGLFLKQAKFLPARFKDLVLSCLANCGCRTGDEDCPADRKEQLKIEVLIKLADINKALGSEGCDGYTNCTAQVYQCTEVLANFSPASAPHVTVNNLNCGMDNLTETLACFNHTCSDANSDLFNNVVIDAFPEICASKHRCMTFGNIYEYVSVYEVNATHPETVTPCAHYRQAPAVAWHVSAISRVQPQLLFDTKTCAPQFPSDVDCPTELGLRLNQAGRGMVAGLI